MSLECFHVHTSASRCQQHQLTCNICAPQTAPTPSPWNSASPPPPTCEAGNKMAATFAAPPPVLLQGRTGERVRSSRWVCVFVVYCSRKWPSREEEEKNSCSWTTTFIKNSGRNQPIRSQPAPDGHKTFYETELICNFILFDGHDAGFMLFFWI